MDLANDSTITPEQAQSMEEKGVVTEEPKVEEPKVEAPEEPKVEEPKVELPKRTIYEDLKEKKIQVREAKEEAESLRNDLTRLSQELENLKQAKNEAKTQSEKDEVDADIAEFAESINADPDAIAALIPIIEKRIGKKSDSEISKEDIEFLRKAKADQSVLAGQVAFNDEWNTFVPSLKAEFPQIDDTDLVNVRKEVERLAHTNEFHDKEVDYIYFKSKKALSNLISPKRPSIEGGSPQANTSERPVSIELSGKSSPMDVQEAISRESVSSSLEIRSSQS